MLAAPTRSRCWRSGFEHITQKAEVPLHVTHVQNPCSCESTSVIVSNITIIMKMHWTKEGPMSVDMKENILLKK